MFCFACCEEKEETLFYIRKTNLRGRSLWCKTCEFHQPYSKQIRASKRKTAPTYIKYTPTEPTPSQPIPVNFTISF